MRTRRCGGVGQTFGIGAQEGCEVLPSLVQQRGQLAHEKANGLFFHLATKFRLTSQNRSGTGAEGSMIEEDDLRVQVPVAGEGACLW
ncbi:MAG: hypothetical protein DRJ65_08360 [Acidobacteria bacterium]|nr:MAG: hypothetical protein DRJ65_08360 [Acidobacteriota bacterium]